MGQERDRFILGAAFSFGVGDLLVPGIFTHLFEGVDNPNKGLKGLFDSITIILSTPCKLALLFRTRSSPDPCPVLIAGVVACVLNLILPQERHTATAAAEAAREPVAPSPDLERGSDGEKERRDVI